MAAMTQLIVDLMVSTRRRGGLGGKCWPLPDWRPDVPHYREVSSDECLRWKRASNESGDTPRIDYYGQDPLATGGEPGTQQLGRIMRPLELKGHLNTKSMI